MRKAKVVLRVVSRSLILAGCIGIFVTQRKIAAIREEIAAYDRLYALAYLQQYVANETTADATCRDDDATSPFMAEYNRKIRHQIELRVWESPICGLKNKKGGSR